MQVDDTIAAVCSAAGGAARGIVRLSGPNVVACLQQCFTAEDGNDPRRHRRASVIPGSLDAVPPIGEVPVDLYLWPTARSYTGQSAAELHTLGSPPILDAIVRTVCAAGARPAEPGEFTMRAFLAGRLDLTQAEAVLGVIDATAHEQLSVALEQLAGGLSTPLARIRGRLLDLLAHLEAGLDFVEEDIAFITAAELDDQLRGAEQQISAIASQMSGRSLTIDEPRVALLGAPNVGKSSLLNALAERSAAIVSPVAGTTRDYLTCRVECDGLPCQLTDTAGIEFGMAAGTVASQAQAMTAQQASQAQLQLLCLDASRRLTAAERSALMSDPEIARLVVMTKCDLPHAINFDGDTIATSSATGAGLDRLAKEVRRRLEASLAGDTPFVAGTALRCRESLRLASASLAQARSLTAGESGEELVAAELRVALDEIGKVAGVIYTDDLLDRIFSRFCIGK